MTVTRKSKLLTIHMGGSHKKINNSDIANIPLKIPISSGATCKTTNNETCKTNKKIFKNRPHQGLHHNQNCYHTKHLHDSININKNNISANNNHQHHYEGDRRVIPSRTKHIAPTSSLFLLPPAPYSLIDKTPCQTHVSHQTMPSVLASPMSSTPVLLHSPRFPIKTNNSVSGTSKRACFFYDMNSSHTCGGIADAACMSCHLDACVSNRTSMRIGNENSIYRNCNEGAFDDRDVLLNNVCTTSNNKSKCKSRRCSDQLSNYTSIGHHEDQTKILSHHTTAAINFQRLNNALWPVDKRTNLTNHAHNCSPKHNNNISGSYSYSDNYMKHAHAPRVFECDLPMSALVLSEEVIRFMVAQSNLPEIMSFKQWFESYLKRVKSKAQHRSRITDHVDLGGRARPRKISKMDSGSDSGSYMTSSRNHHLEHKKIPRVSNGATTLTKTHTPPLVLDDLTRKFNDIIRSSDDYKVLRGVPLCGDKAFAQINGIPGTSDTNANSTMENEVFRCADASSSIETKTVCAAVNTTHTKSDKTEMFASNDVTRASVHSTKKSRTHNKAEFKKYCDRDRDGKFPSCHELHTPPTVSKFTVFPLHSSPVSVVGETPAIAGALSMRILNRPRLALPPPPTLPPSSKPAPRPPAEAPFVFHGSKSHQSVAEGRSSPAPSIPLYTEVFDATRQPQSQTAYVQHLQQKPENQLYDYSDNYMFTATNAPKIKAAPINNATSSPKITAAPSTVPSPTTPPIVFRTPPSPSTAPPLPPPLVRSAQKLENRKVHLYDAVIPVTTSSTHQVLKHLSPSNYRRSMPIIKMSNVNDCTAVGTTYLYWATTSKYKKLGLVHIGCTNHPSKRISMLNVGNEDFFQFLILYKVNNRNESERVISTSFANQLVNSNGLYWFRRLDYEFIEEIMSDLGRRGMISFSEDN